MCEYKPKEWETGFEALGCSTVGDLKKMLPSLREELKDEATFKVDALSLFFSLSSFLINSSLITSSLLSLLSHTR